MTLSHRKNNVEAWHLWFYQVPRRRLETGSTSDRNVVKRTVAQVDREESHDDYASREHKTFFIGSDLFDRSVARPVLTKREVHIHSGFIGTAMSATTSNPKRPTRLLSSISLPIPHRHYHQQTDTPKDERIISSTLCASIHPRIYQTLCRHQRLTIAPMSFTHPEVTSRSL